MTDDLLKQKTITDAARSVPTATSLTPQTVPLRQGDERSGGGGLTAHPSSLNIQHSTFNIHRSPLTVNFFHHPLLCNAEGQRLCKRDKSMDLGYLRGTGITPQEIIGKLAYLAGLTDTTTPITPSELLLLFSWKKVPTEDIILK
ncbi:MAG: hypothetical protein UH687_00235 [Bacteroidaceae bacterium]|nr:hypothetical protein [Bacteroidaceae bacterium]